MIDWKEYKQADRVVVRYFNDDELVGKQVIYRPTPTKTVADNSQTSCSEGEKWTHTYNELKCCALITEPDREGYIIIVNELNEYYVVEEDELKPIKPTMTKDEQEKVAQFIARVWSKSNPDLRAEFDSFCKEHEII